MLSWPKAIAKAGILAVIELVSRHRSLTLQDLLEKKLSELSRKIETACGMTVQSGPFPGMQLPKAYYLGVPASKLLGFYEAEIASSLSKIVAMGPDTIIDVGAAEGYYAVGLALSVDSAEVYAFDTNPEAQSACQKTAELNGVSDRVHICGECSPADLEALLGNAKRPFLFLDCEGAERELLFGTSPDSLLRAHILVECHDFIDRQITTDLKAKFSGSHKIVEIEQSSRDPNLSPILKSWPEFDKWLVVSEFRPETMHWLVMTPQQLSAN